MNIQLYKEIAVAEHRGEFDYAETLKGFDSKPVEVCQNCTPENKVWRYREMINRIRSAN